MKASRMSFKCSIRTTNNQFYNSKMLGKILPHESDLLAELIKFKFLRTRQSMNLIARTYSNHSFKELHLWLKECRAIVFGQKRKNQWFNHKAIKFCLRDNLGHWRLLAMIEEPLSLTLLDRFLLKFCRLWTIQMTFRNTQQKQIIYKMTKKNNGCHQEQINNLSLSSIRIINRGRWSLFRKIANLTALT